MGTSSRFSTNREAIVIVVCIELGLRLDERLERRVPELYSSAQVPLRWYELGC
jgi:hypothetical protein